MDVQTVTGPVQADHLGFTLMHEHLALISVGMYENWPHLIDMDEVRQTVTDALVEARMNGVQTIVDLTTPNLGRDAVLMGEIAEAAQVNVVCATGMHPLLPVPHYLAAVFGPRSATDIDEVADLFVRDLEVGIADTGIRAGVIKLGTDPHLDKLNEVLLRAGCRAHRRTGAPISTHTHPGNKVGLIQQDIFESEGVDLSRVVIGHSGDSLDIEYLSAICRRGSYVGMDRFGFTLSGLPTTEDRIAIIKVLCDRGFANQIVLSHDSACWSDTFSEEFIAEALGDNNLVYISKQVLPMMRTAGISDTDISAMTIVNPREILSPGEPY